MATNAPYYQLRGGHSDDAPNNTNAAPQFVSDDEFDMSTSAAIVSPLDNLHTSVYAEHCTRQASTDNTLEENHHLAELLEAATTAQTMNVNDTDAVLPAHEKRKRTLPVLDIDATTHEVTSGSSTKKRRIAIPTDPHLPESGRRLPDDSVNTETSPQDESFSHDTRVPGVHSAAALFRPCSESTSRKQTRPPMSKLFISLQISPENFLQLQAEAKTYMLDSKHPERQSCVGNRGKGDTDMVKLRLFNCVRDFLNDGAGEKFFGEHVEKPDKSETIEAAHALRAGQASVADQRLTWPRDGNRIISLVRPLMRRMVTNERQRQYAIETRKGGTKKKEREESMDAISLQRASNNSRLEVSQQFQPSLDPNLSQIPRLSNPATLSRRNETMANQNSLPERRIYSPEGSKMDTKNITPTLFDSTWLKLPSEGQNAPNLFHINIFLILAACGTRPDIKLDETRITPEPPQKHLACYDWEKFLQHIITMFKRAGAKYSDVQIRQVNQESRTTTANLRGLAAAANALSNTDTNKEIVTSSNPANTEGSPSSSLDGNSKEEAKLSNPIKGVATNSTASSPEDAPPIPPPASALNNESPSSTNAEPTQKLLPHYIIKTIGSQGWRTIKNAKDWHDMLMEKAFTIWADGVCNVIVELVDMPLLDSLVETSAQRTEEHTRH